jgi:hypothetical protein
MAGRRSAPVKSLSLCGAFQTRSHCVLLFVRFG